MNLTKVIIETDRLKLIPISEKFAQDIFREFTPEITKYMYPKSAKKIEETLNFIYSSIEKMKKGIEYQVVVLNKTTGEYVGGAGISKLNTDTPEPGIWIKKEAHGNKYGREAVGALIEWIENKYKYKYIMYPVDKRNVSSRKIPDSLGGIIEAEYKKINASGNELDMIEYRIYPHTSS